MLSSFVPPCFIVINFSRLSWLFFRLIQNRLLHPEAVGGPSALSLLNLRSRGHPCAAGATMAALFRGTREQPHRCRSVVQAQNLAYYRMQKEGSANCCPLCFLTRVSPPGGESRECQVVRAAPFQSLVGAAGARSRSSCSLCSSAAAGPKREPAPQSKEEIPGAALFVNVNTLVAACPHLSFGES